MDELERDCICTLAQAKGIMPEVVMPESTLDELGLDSLDRVSLSFDLEEKYGVELPESHLVAMKTVGDVVAEIREALLKKNSSAMSSATNEGQTR